MKFPAGRMASQADKSYGIYEAALRLQAQGANVIHLGIGRPSDDTPEPICAATKAALDAQCVHYGDLQGTRALRHALAARYRREQGLDIGADEVLITNGVTQASFAAFMAAIDPGDEVIVLDPYYPQHNSKIALLGGMVVPVAMACGAGRFALDEPALRAAITPRTRMLVLINPGNPTGTVWTRGELQRLAALAIEHDLLVLADEVYEYIVFDGRSHLSLASLPGMWERTITVSAFTKAYAMDGWRIGYAVAPAPIIRQMKLVTTNLTTHPNVFAQQGAIEAVTGSQLPRQHMLENDRRRRDLVVERLSRIPGIRCPRPEGSIYAFPDIRELGLSSAELSHRLLEGAHVAVEAGAFYGHRGEGHLRLCVASEPYARVAEALDRIEAFVRAGLR